jgi:hypothetical protein
MTGLVRAVADRCVRSAARRWPAQLRDDLLRQWLAELDAIIADPAQSQVARWCSAIAFAVSLAVSPAVEEAGAPARTWQDRWEALARLCAGAASLAGITLVAAGLATAVRALPAGRSVPAILVVVALLVAAVVVMAVMGAHTTMARDGADAAGRSDPGWWSRWSRRRPVTLPVPIGAALFGFLLAGNPIAVMPFMGARDVGPAVAIWIALTALTLLGVRWLRGHDFGRLATMAAIGGSLVTLDLATMAGSLHAASSLGLSAGSGPAWFPLALLPGGTAEFGGVIDAVTVGGNRFAGLDVPASALLLGNASAMVGPMLLCTAFVMASALRAPVPVNTGRRVAPVPAGPLVMPAGRVSVRLAAARRMVIRSSLPPRTDAESPSGPLQSGSPASHIQLALRIVVVASAMPVTVLIARAAIGRLSITSTDAIDRITANSYAFGFGFAAHPAGQVGLAILVAVVTARWLRLDEWARRQPADP